MGWKAWIVIGMVMLILGSVTGAYLYVDNLQSENAELTAANKLQEQAIKTQNETIERQKKSFEDMRQKHAESEQLNRKLQKINDEFSKKLEQHDFEHLARNKPGLIANIINNASADKLRCIEIATGSELTRNELNASKPSEINDFCWDIANPNFDWNAQSEAWKRRNLQR